MRTKKSNSLDKVRVIGIFAHVDAGKTTTSEAVLYHTGRIHRVGSVDEGSTQLDWMTQERERGITVTSAATTCDWRGHRINLIDTPGHIDFSAEVVRSIRVIDGAVIVLCGVGGIEPQTEGIWLHAERGKLARFLFVNKLDRRGADFERVMAQIRDRLTPDAVVLQLPIGREGDFRGVVDLIEGKALVWRGDAAEPSVEPVPADMADQVATARTSLIEAICETDDILLEQWVAGEEPEATALRRALRRATVRGALVPVFCGSALRRIGIQPLLDAVVAYLPAPGDVEPVAGIAPAGADLAGEEATVTRRPAEPDAPLCAAAFKIVRDPYVGHLTWVRMFSGRLGAGDTVHNPRTQSEERVQRIYRMHADQREQVDEVLPGGVAALVGVKSALTGDTLCDPAHPIILEAQGFPEPVIMVALTASSDEERGRLQEAVRHLCDEDPTLVMRQDAETGELTLAGLGELHLEIAVDRLRTEFDVVASVSPPKITYRETVRGTAEVSLTYSKQTGGHGHYARVQVRIEPLERGAGVVFENDAPGSELPAEVGRPTELGVREALESGILAGWPITDVRVTLLGGKFHEVDSSGQDFEIAGSMAVKDAARRAKLALLEPMMRLDLNVHEQELGAVTADLGRRRGRITGMEVRGGVCSLSGEVPLAEVRGYATDLRSLTHGRGTFILEFRRYEFVPAHIAEALVVGMQPAASR